MICTDAGVARRRRSVSFLVGAATYELRRPHAADDVTRLQAMLR
jgi:hypothetical protein